MSLWHGHNFLVNPIGGLGTMNFIFIFSLSFWTFSYLQRLILLISQSQIIGLGIYLEYLHSIPPRAPAALGALRLLRTLVAIAFFALPATTAMRCSSVAATNRPPRHGLPCPTLVHLIEVASLLALRMGMYSLIIS